MPRIMQQDQPLLISPTNTGAVKEAPNWPPALLKIPLCMQIMCRYHVEHCSVVLEPIIYCSREGIQILFSWFFGILDIP